MASLVLCIVSFRCRLRTTARSRKPYRKSRYDMEAGLPESRKIEGLWDFESSPYR